MRCNFLLKNSLLLVFILAVSCKKEEPVEIKYRYGHVDKTSKQYLIPSGLRKHIESEYLKYLKEKTFVTLTDQQLIETIPRDFLDVDILFRSGELGVLSQHTKFTMPRGGGEIDLREYVKAKKGAFYMKYAARRSSEPDTAVSDLRVYFFSEAKERKIGKEKYGAGCKAFMDITSYMTKQNSEGGLELNALDQSYASVLGGVFYFVEFADTRKLYISAVRIVDSRYPDLYCEGVQK